MKPKRDVANVDNSWRYTSNEPAETINDIEWNETSTENSSTMKKEKEPIETSEESENIHKTNGDKSKRDNRLSQLEHLCNDIQQKLQILDSNMTHNKFIENKIKRMSPDQDVIV